MVLRRGLYAREDLNEAVQRCLSGEKIVDVAKTSSVPISTIKKYLSFEKRARNKKKRDVDRSQLLWMRERRCSSRGSRRCSEVDSQQPAEILCFESTK